jgi:hypothetical protein
MSDLVPQQQLASIDVYDRIANPMDAIKILGSAIFKSGIFGCEKAEQGEVLAMQCLAERKSPLELARTYHFIQGQLAIRTDALLAKFQQAGGKVDWKERTDIRVVAVFSKPGQSGVEIVADLEEYKRNGTAYKADGKTIKDNWHRWPRRMLTARAISEGVRLVAPECCFGVAVSDEGESSFKTRTAINLDLSDIIPEGKEEQAKALFLKMGFLKEGQEISDLDPARVKALRKQGDTLTDLLLQS